MPDVSQIVNEDLVLEVSPAIDPAVFEISKYEAFIDLLCGTREYQKEAIRTSLRYMLGGRYASLRDLAEENYATSLPMQERYGSFSVMERMLMFPDKLSASLDLATGTGKSYVLYALAAIMLAEGAVDRVLVLCPSLTIEAGLKEKFQLAAGGDDLRDRMPDASVVRAPSIISGNESIVDGSICIENYHAVLPRAGSSLRPTLEGKGERTLVLNDETHHVYAGLRDLRKWAEFVAGDEFRFKYVIGASGTCYAGDDYLPDVIARYSLRGAIEEGFVKTIDYVAEDTSSNRDEKFQKVHANHVFNKTQAYARVKPLTILVTRDIAACNRLAEELVDFLSEQESIPRDDAASKVLAITSDPKHRANVAQLPLVDQPDNSVEWITSVSMLTEGWDVKNVFQIVPHEERAFNSKLLIAQVLGRGLRIPDEYRGERPVATVFNHDAWSSRIRHLVDEVLEIESRLGCEIATTRSPDYNFPVHRIDYTKSQQIERHDDTGEYEFSKGYVALASQVEEVEKETIYARAVTGGRRARRTRVRYKMYPIDEVVAHLHSKFKAIDVEEGTGYAEKYTTDWLHTLVQDSLVRIGEDQDRVSEENRQRLQRAFGVVHRKAGQTVRYTMTANAVAEGSTRERHRDSIGVSSLRRGESTVFYDDQSGSLSDEATQSVLREIIDDESLPRSAIQHVENSFDFRTPLNLVIADHRPERQFVAQLVRPENARVLAGWIKSTDTDFYPIEYSWRKGEHVKRGFFNPDFFICVDSSVLVIEIKGDEEVDDPSQENRAKYAAACEHFDLLNSELNEEQYFFHFLTPRDYDAFFQFLRDERLDFTSSLDAALLARDNDAAGRT